MVRTAVLAGFAFALLLGGPVAACASEGDPAPAPAAKDAVAEALAAAEAARAKVAAADAAVAEASRAKRSALLEAIRTEGALAEAYLAAGMEKEASASEARLARLLAALSAAGGAPEPRPANPVSDRPFSGRRGPVAVKAPTASPGLPAFDPRADNTADRAVGEALRWLAAHQGPAGNWDADGFGACCKDGSCPGTGGPLYDPGVTSLALLAFLGAGETHKTPKHGETVERALKYLMSIQDPEGCFGPRTSNHFTYNHALCALAMCEAYGMTGSPNFKESAQAGIRFVLRAQNPYLAWRYGVKPQDNDTSVTCWMVMALKSGKAAGLEVDEAAFQGALAWLDKVTEQEYGRVGYTARGNGPARPMELMDTYPADRSESLTAEGVLARFLCGQTRDHPMVGKGLALIGKTLPSWDDMGGIDFYYWYFGTLATFQAGGDAWRDWNGAVGKALLPHQRGEESGCARGSWDPVDPWGMEGGRIYSTALGALCMEVKGRFDKAFGGK